MQNLAMFVAAALAGFSIQVPAQSPPSRSIAESDERIVQFVVGPKLDTLYTLSAKGTMACWSLGKNAESWRMPSEKMQCTAISMGTEFLYSGMPMPMVDRIDPIKGERGPGVGAPGLMNNAKALVYAADPKDRWVWIGLSDGWLNRVVPADVKSWSKRDLKNGGVTSLAIDTEGKLMAAGGEDMTIRFVGASSANIDDKKIIEGHKAPITALAFVPKGTELLSGAKDGGLRLSSVASCKSRFELMGHTAAVRALAIDTKGTRAATGDDSGAVRLWDLSSGKELSQFHLDGAVSSLAFLEKGKTLAASGGGRAIVLWELPK